SPEHQREAKTDLRDIFWFERGEKEFQDFQAYCDSKFHVMLLARAVPRRFTVGGKGGTDKLEDGVETYIMLAEGDYDQSLIDLYFEPKRKIGTPLIETANEDLQKLVLKACEDLTGLQLGP
ncbi:hypothetical protein N7454_001918, partial [Penicillium verhagenii]